MNMMVAVRAEFERARCKRILLWMLVAYLLVLAFYLFSNQGVWDNTTMSDGSGVMGFYPEPRVAQFMLDEMESGNLSQKDVAEDETFLQVIDANELPVVSPLAHTMFFFPIAIIVIGIFDGEAVFGQAGLVSQTRGGKPSVVLAARIVVALVYAIGAYTVFSIAIAVLEPVLYDVTMNAAQWSEFIWRLVPCVLVCASEVVLISLATSLFGRGTYVLGTLLLLTYLGHSTAICPLHVTWLMHLCAPCSAAPYIVPSAIFSIVSAGAVALLAAVVVAVKRKRA